MDAAAREVEANIKVVPDDKAVRRQLAEIARRHGAEHKFLIPVEVQERGLKTRLEAVVKEARAGVKLNIQTDLNAAGLGAKARAEKEKAQKAAGPMKIPVELDFQRGLKGLASIGKLIKFPAIVAAITPLVGLVSALTAGAVALAGAISPVIGLAGALPGALTAVAQSMGTVKLATSGMGDAFKEVGKAQAILQRGGKLTTDQQQKLKAALDGLSPAARSFVEQIVRVQPAFAQLQGAVQQSFFAPFTKQVAGLANQYLPMLSAALRTTAGILGGTVASLGKLAATQPFRADFTRILATNNVVIKTLAGAATSLVQAFVDITVSAGPMLTTLAGIAATGAKTAAAFISQQRASGGLAQFFQQALVVGRQLGRIFVNLAVGLFNIGKAGAPLGRDLLRQIEDLTRKFREFTGSVTGQNQLAQFFADAKPGIEAAGRLIGALGKAFLSLGNDPALAPLLDQIRTQLGPALTNLITQLNGALGPALVGAATSLLNLFSSIASGGGGGLTSFVNTITLFLDALNKIITTVPGAQTALTGFLVAAGTARALTGITSIIGGTGKAIFDMGSKSVGAIRGVGQFVGAMRDVSKGAGPAASGAQKFGAALSANIGGGVAVVKGAVASAAAGLRSLGAALIATSAQYLRLAAAATASALATLRQAAAAVAARVAAVAIRGALLAWTAAQWLLNVAMSANPFALIVIAIIALVAAIVIAYKKSETFRAIVTAVWNAIKAVVLTAINIIVAYVRTYFTIIATIITTYVNIWKAIITTAWNIIKTVVTTAISLIVAYVKTYFAIISAVITTYVNVWRAIITTAWSVIRAVISAAVSAVRAVISAGFAAVSAVIRAATAAWRAVVSAVMAAIRSLVSAGISAVKAAFNGISAIVGIIKGAFDRAKSAVSTAIGAIVALVKGLPGKVTGALGNLGGLLFDAGKQLIQGFINGIEAMAGKVAGAAKKVLGGVANLVPHSPVEEGPLKVFNRGYTGRELIRMFIGGIQAEQDNLARAMTGLASLVANPFAPAGAGATGGFSAQYAAAGAAAGRAAGAGAMRNTTVTVNAAPDIPTSQQILRVLSYAEALHA